MRRKLIVLGLALTLSVLANLRPGCAVEGADGCYSPRALRLGRLAASRAAEEIVPGGGALPRLRESWRLSLRQPEDSVPALTRAFLSRIPGVVTRSEVRVNGVSLGTVADGEALKEALRVNLYVGRPAAAVSSRYTEELTIAPVFSRSSRGLDESSMLQLIRNLCPVMYVDREGKIIA